MCVCGLSLPKPLVYRIARVVCRWPVDLSTVARRLHRPVVYRKEGVIAVGETSSYGSFSVSPLRLAQTV